jgi:hypothetical protein
VLRTCRRWTQPSFLSLWISNCHHFTEHGFKNDRSPCEEYWSESTNHPFPGKVKEGITHHRAWDSVLKLYLEWVFSIKYCVVMLFALRTIR